MRVVLIDRQNHHLFQPLLYQVATSVLSSAQTASPIRGILRSQRNTTVILGEVTGVDSDRRRVFVDSVDREGVALEYDYLILAKGASHSYFGRDEFARFAPGLKSLADAVSIRNQILRAFEQAEAEEDPKRHRDLLTFVLVGAGPTGVEMAGALAPRVLGPFAGSLSAAARTRLDQLGVEVRLGHGVEDIDADGVVVAGERIASKTVIWTVGVAPAPAGKWLKAATDRPGRVRVQQDLSVPGHPEIFVIGDTASLDQDGHPLPGVAQGAMQQGRYAGMLIHRRIVAKSAPPPLHYFDKGTMAVVGKGFAVLQSGRLRLSGFLAWPAWATVQLEFLAQVASLDPFSRALVKNLRARALPSIEPMACIWLPLCSVENVRGKRGNRKTH